MDNIFSSMLVCNSSQPTPHREDNTLVDKISGWPSAGATSNMPQITLSTTKIPLFYQRPISGKVPVKMHTSPANNPLSPYYSTLSPKPFEHSPETFEFLALKRKYSASTQTAWEEVNWNKKLNSTHIPILQHQKMSVPDPVANFNRIPRYFTSTCNWQDLGNSWDYVQSRNSPKKKFPGFISQFRNNNKIPGYTGHTTTECNDISEHPCFNSNNNNYTCTSKGPNIQGYSGCQHWTQTQPTHHIMDHRGVYSATSLREFKFFPSQKTNDSPFTRSGVLSKMISLTSPYNPFINQL